MVENNPEREHGELNRSELRRVERSVEPPSWGKLVRMIRHAMRYRSRVAALEKDLAYRLIEIEAVRKLWLETERDLEWSARRLQAALAYLSGEERREFYRDMPHKAPKGWKP